MRSLTELDPPIAATTEWGLTAEQVLQSRARYGANRLTALPRESLWKRFLSKFDEPIITILLAAALLSMFVELFTPPVERLRYGVGGVAVAVELLILTGAYLTRRGHWV